MKELLKKLNNSNYESYIVGGFVRDKLLNRDSFDIDICTNAKISDIKKLFPGGIYYNKYGSYHFNYKEYKVNITAFRKELLYKDNKPIEIEYVSDLYTDLLRRDFTMNTVCLDKNFNIVDLLEARNDISNKLIKTVGDTYTSFEEDNTRILRAIRFMCELGFDLDNEIIEYIKENKNVIGKININKRKEELDKIFSCNNNIFFKFIEKYDLKRCFEIDYDQIVIVDNYLGIWAQIDSNYSFTKDELYIINSIRNILKNGITRSNIYKYGYSISLVASKILGIEEKHEKFFLSIPINSIMDLDIEISDLISVKGDYKKSNKLMKKIESEVVELKLENKKEKILKWVLDWSIKNE